MEKNTRRLTLEKLVEKYAVKNALEHRGACDPKAVLGKVISENPELKKQIKSIIKKTKGVCERINSLSEKEQKKIYEKYTYKEKEVKKKVLKELPNAKNGEVVMRLAPFPSGPLHLGNARPAILNDEYVKKYNGMFILAIDDTIGSKEKVPIKEAYKLIIEGLKWLGVNIDKIVYKSDRMNLFYTYAELFLKQGWAYVCTCPSKKLRENRKKGIECEHRNQSPEKNLEEWEKMLSGFYKEGQAVVRLKTNMKDKDPAFRDRVLLRISEVNHPRVGKKYRVWPMLEFSWAIDDHELRITHILRGKDLAMEDKMEKYMWDLLKWKHPEIIHNGIMNIEGAKISKSKAQKEVKEKTYTGWDDPRTWSLQSLRKRGFEPESIRRFILGVGLTETDIRVPIENLYRENRILIEKKANRYFFIENPIKFEVKGIEKTSAYIPLHPDFPKRGKRKLTLENVVYLDPKDAKSENVRLKGLGNFKINGNLLKFIDSSPSTAKKKNLPIIHWLPEGIAGNVIMPSGKMITGLCEANILNERKGEVVQLERMFFARLDKKRQNKILFYYTHK